MDSVFAGALLGLAVEESAAGFELSDEEDESLPAEVSFDAPSFDAPSFEPDESDDDPSLLFWPERA